jgi:DNA-binding winged helix-turn-helix (wHTH) protein
MMTTNSDTGPALYRENPPPYGANRSSPAAADAILEFGRFRVLLRRRQLVADGVPVELGARAFDLLLALLEADGSLVTKEELISRVWPGIVVSEENLKVQISLLRKALGEERNFIRTEFGRGYRFTAAVRSTFASGACQRPTRRRRPPKQRVVPPMDARPPPHGSSRGQSGRHFDLAPPRAPRLASFWISSAARKGEDP